MALAGAVTLGVSTLVPVGHETGAPPAPTPCGPSPRPAFFTDEAVQPPQAAPDRPGHYTLTAHVGRHAFASTWPAVPTLGYSAPGAPMDYLGPTITTREGQPVDVTVFNALPARGVSLFPFGQPTNDNSITLHRHGGLQAPEDDGAPSPIQPQINPGSSRTNHYPDSQAAAPLWYHDHADMLTPYHAYEGLAGYMPNTDDVESGFGLPDQQFSDVYVLQDKSFHSDMTLCYSHANEQFFGDLPVINGTIAPKQQVEPRRYIFTFLNASDSRFYRLGLTQAGGSPADRPTMTVVSDDSGYLVKPAPVSDLLIAPGERYRVVVDFTGHESQNWVLSNTAAKQFPSSFPDGVDGGGGGIPQLMRFDVGGSVSSPDRSRIPDVMAETNNDVPMPDLLAPARLRTVQAGESSPGVPQLGDRDRLLNYLDPATETPQLGSTEVWAMRNHSPEAHPIHEHLVELYLVGRWHVGQWDANGRPVPASIGPFVPAAPYESGPKDTFVAPPGWITAWVGTYTIGGTSVWHCHLLSHEDGLLTDGAAMMMRPLAVGSAPQTQLPLVLSQAGLDQLIRQP